MRTHTWTHTCRHAHVWTHMRTHTHTHTRAEPQSRKEGVRGSSGTRRHDRRARRTGAGHPALHSRSVWLRVNRQGQRLGSLTSNLNLETCLPLSFPGATTRRLSPERSTPPPVPAHTVLAKMGLGSQGRSHTLTKPDGAGRSFSPLPSTNQAPPAQREEAALSFHSPPPPTTALGPQSCWPPALAC